ncbi:MAG TPA: M2 family metallopeptidase [Dongiaceae bacterium]|nr:M2 family metallopeptidase [Dongiaceae bacterium]
MKSVTRSDREQALAAFIGTHEQRYVPLHVAYNEAAWMLNVTGEERWGEEAERHKLAMHDTLSRPEDLRFLLACRDSGEVRDPLLARQLALLICEFTPHQIPRELHERIVRLETRLESAFNNFRAELDGERVSDNVLRQVLRESGDADRRRRAWEAAKQIGATVAPELVELVRLRNEAARVLGFRDHYGMSLILDELDETELVDLLDRVERDTRAPWQAYKGELDAGLARRFGCDPRELRPWHYGDPFFQEAPVADVGLDEYFTTRSLEDTARRFFAAVGFDIRDLLARADLYEKPGKSQHAFCMSVDRRDDIRILCNLRPNEYWMGTLLHELGHAVYDQTIDRSLPFFLRAHAHILTTEASAMLFGRLTKNAAWLTAWAGAPADEAAGRAAAIARAIRDQLLVQTRWNLVMCAMERALYADPGRDLNTLWWDLVERYQDVRRPDGRDAPDWASKIHFSVAPVYYHNYLLGEIMASQLQAHLLDHVIGGGSAAWPRVVSDPAVGAYLRERIYRGGRTRDWRDTLIAATGRPLDPGAFVSELAGRA